MKLFAVYLGGRVPKCNTELHDVVFVVGDTIEATYPQLLERWFGQPEGLHIDSWLELKWVDGHEIDLSHSPDKNSKKLYFVNLGAYQAGKFTELHECAFLVAENPTQVKLRAKAELLQGKDSVHKDDLFDIDDCLEISRIGDLFIRVHPTHRTEILRPQNGYHVIPKAAAV